MRRSWKFAQDVWLRLCTETTSAIASSPQSLCDLKLQRNFLGQDWNLDILTIEGCNFSTRLPHDDRALTIITMSWMRPNCESSSSWKKVTIAISISISIYISKEINGTEDLRVREKPMRLLVGCHCDGSSFDAEMGRSSISSQDAAKAW